MKTQEAQRVLDSLRKGIPPDGFIGHFTVGREAEIRSLTSRLQRNTGGSLLLKANYGCGKSHLLRFVRETALLQGYAVSTITLDAKSAVRFNRMDQIMGAIWRGLEVPDAPGQYGPAPFFDFLIAHMRDCLKQQTKNAEWRRITNGYMWDNSHTLRSKSAYITLRCWERENTKFKAQLEDWLCQPWSHNISWLVDYVRLCTPFTFYKKDLNFILQDYEESWSVLYSIHVLARAAGLKGLVILFDEFEDVFNLRNGVHEQIAFWNLFEFFKGVEFQGMAFFAVTPGFVQKCKRLLLRKGYDDYDATRFDSLPTFEMTPLEADNLKRLALRIAEVHGEAYPECPDRAINQAELDSVVHAAASVAVQDRARHIVKAVVRVLDDTLEHD